VTTEKLIQCHGSFATATCISCGFKTKGEDILPETREGKVPKCTKCIQRIHLTGGLKRKNSRSSSQSRKNGGRDSHDDSSEDDDIEEAGVMKVSFSPSITK
jgi:NAD-dependent histone deacetylase SIR2